MERSISPVSCCHVLPFARCLEEAQAPNAQPLSPRSNAATMPTAVAEQNVAPKHGNGPDATLRHHSEGPRRWLVSLGYECRRKRKIKRPERARVCVCATSDYQLIFSCYEIRLAQLPCWEKQYSSFEMEGLLER